MADYTLEAKGISVTLDLAVGHIAELVIEIGGRVLRPLHRAPWIGETDLPADIAPGLARLSGDFLCAPFGKSDVEEAPVHGWTANSEWILVRGGPIEGGFRASFRLKRKVMGATVTKNLTVRDNHPFLYQEHKFSGGSGGLSMAHHTMVSMEDGGTLSMSAKRLAMTPNTPLEPDPERGRYLLQYPGRSDDVQEFPTEDGGTVDLLRYPLGGGEEDFVVLLERYKTGMAFTALSRKAEEDIVVTLKNATIFPVTMLWYSNAGRDYAPWNGRHRGVLGIEDGRASPMGHAASLADNPLTQAEVKTAFDLDPEQTLSVYQVIGALPSPGRGIDVTAVRDEHGAAVVELGDAGSGRFPFDDTFLVNYVQGN